MASGYYAWMVVQAFYFGVAPALPRRGACMPLATHRPRSGRGHTESPSARPARGGRAAERWSELRPRDSLIGRFTGRRNNHVGFLRWLGLPYPALLVLAVAEKSPASSVYPGRSLIRWLGA